MAQYDDKRDARDRFTALSGPKPQPMAALDIGTNKVTCLIVKPEGMRQSDRMIRAAGVGHQISRGVRSGAITDMDAAEVAIRTAVEQAERMAGVTISEVRVTLSAAQLLSHRISVEINVGGHEISERDLKQAIQVALDRFEAPGRTAVHAVPVNYAVDGERGVRDPRGLYAQTLGVDLHVVTSASAPLRNLIYCVERCHLDVVGVVVEPYASALASLTDDEADMGTICIDMGAGSTSLAVMRHAALSHIDVIPVGGGHITADLARGLSTPLASAERIKTLHGSALACPDDNREMIDVPQLGEDRGYNVTPTPRAMLSRVIAPRLEETFELVRDRLAAAGIDRVQHRRVVLVGAASQLVGAQELAGRILERQVRLGRPVRLTGVADAAQGPGFAATAGVIHHAAFGPRDAFLQAFAARPKATVKMMANGGNKWVQAFNWMRENF